MDCENVKNKTRLKVFLDLGHVVYLFLWLVLTAWFAIFTIYSGWYPSSFEKYWVQLGFLGITLSLLAMFLYLFDNYKHQKNDNQIEERLKNIERICNQWDQDK